VSRTEDPGPLVELVDRDGQARGSMPKLEAHRAPGALHRAVSVFLLDGDGRVVLQQRAGGKYHSADLWSNTCCGHPEPGEAPVRAAARRLMAELGLEVAPAELVEAGVVIYEVRDPGSELVERELNHVYVGRMSSVPQPDPAEVRATAAVDLEDLLVGPPSRPMTAWFEVVLRVALPPLRRLRAALPESTGRPSA
jgi:isopentenyl-diphosphate delta-isomerase